MNDEEKDDLLWAMVRDCFDEKKFDEHLEKLTPELTDELFGVAIVELHRAQRRLLLARRATDILATVGDNNATDDEIKELIADTDVLDRKVGICPKCSGQLVKCGCEQ